MADGGHFDTRVGEVLTKLIGLAVLGWLGSYVSSALELTAANEKELLALKATVVSLTSRAAAPRFTRDDGDDMDDDIDSNRERLVRVETFVGIGVPPKDGD